MTPMWGIAYSSQDDMPRIKIVYYSMWEDEAEAFFHTVLFLSFLFAHIRRKPETVKSCATSCSS